MTGSQDGVESVIETVLIADTQAAGRIIAEDLGLPARTTRIVSKPDQLRGWSLRATVRVIDRTRCMSASDRQGIEDNLALCKATISEVGNG